MTITGRVKIGRNVHIAVGACFFGGGLIELEDYVGISAGVKVFTATEDLSGEYLTNPTVPAELTNPRVAPVRIGRHAVIGANSVILPGADVGEGSCVGALSLVKEPLAPWGIYAGIPARRIKDRSNHLLQLERKDSQ